LHVCADKGESKSPAHTGESSEYYGLGIEREMTGKLLKLFFIMASCLAAAVLLLTASSAFAMDTEVISATTGFDNRQGRPDIHGNLITWKRCSPVASGYGYDIYMYNLAKPGEQEQLISTNASDPTKRAAGNQINPVTNGSFILWEDWSTGSGEIFMKDVLSGTAPEPLLTGTASTGNQAILSISGNMLVYVSNLQPSYVGKAEDDPNNNIYVVDLTNRTPEPVSTADKSQWQPRISGTRVVWQDKRNGHFDIFMKDLATGDDEEQVTWSPGDDKYADISGDWIVWQRTVNGVTDIYKKNIADDGSDEAAVTNDTAHQSSPRISGDLITWMDSRALADQIWNIYKKDLTGSSDEPIAPSTSTQAYQAMDGEKIVWEECGTCIDRISGIDKIIATVPDITAPVIGAPNPADGSATGCSSPVISAVYSDNRVGIDTGSILLTVDGQDVTKSATVTDKKITYQPKALQDGLHPVSLTVYDQSGNSASASWTFHSSHPSLQLTSQTPSWASYTDYHNRELSVQYRITNSSADSNAMQLQILGSLSTAEVIMASKPPVKMGDLAPGAQGDVMIKYRVHSVGSFKTTLYASCLDTCGSTYYFPGPLPD